MHPVVTSPMLQTLFSSGKIVLYDYAGDDAHSEQMRSEGEVCLASRKCIS